MNKRHLNIVVVGRSGVGKSSFLNYAAGKQVFETGKGDPVTQSYFDCVELPVVGKNIVYALYDTKGLEAGNTSEWQNAIFNEIERRDKSSDIYSWFHTIIYCIDASSKRIQPFEMASIKMLEKRGSVLVLLTKADLVSTEILEDLKKCIRDEVGTRVQVLSVCSVSQRTRKGESKAFGLDSVLRVCFLGLWEKASKILPLWTLREVAYKSEPISLNIDSAGLRAYYFLSINKPQNIQLLCQSTVTFASFKAIEDKAHAAIYNDGGKVRFILHSGTFKGIFALPDKLVHGMLDVNTYRQALKIYLNRLQEIFELLCSQIKEKLPDIRHTFGEHNAIIRDILSFYNDITGDRQDFMSLHKTDESIAALEELDYDLLIKTFRQKKYNLVLRLNEIDKCVFFSSEERGDANSSYSEFKGAVLDMVNMIDSRINSYLDNYRAELHSYGQYCIREDDLVETRKSDVGIECLRNLIKIALQDNCINLKERMMLEKMSESLGLSRTQLDDLIREVAGLK